VLVCPPFGVQSRYEWFVFSGGLLLVNAWQPISWSYALIFSKPLSSGSSISPYRKRVTDSIFNTGGDRIAHSIRTVDRSVPLRFVTASRGKITRAEPVSALYEQGRVHHVGCFPTLEDQMCDWVAGTPESPDRMDALVWAITDLDLRSVQKIWLG
jgi:phage terminase large subunit-like protein